MQYALAVVLLLGKKLSLPGEFRFDGILGFALEEMLFAQNISKNINTFWSLEA